MSTRYFSVLAVCGLLMAAVPVAAHHALVAQYDMDKPIEITGTLNKMEFINPHSMLHLDVKNPNGTRDDVGVPDDQRGVAPVERPGADRRWNRAPPTPSRALPRETATRWASFASSSSRTRRR